MKKTPSISVILPVYNVEKYLRECLDSVAGQTLRDIEIICVNDGSTDGSGEILREYSQKDERFVILEQENKGAGAARNLGLTAAHGAYLLFLDADDFFERDMVKKSYKRAQETNADIVIFGADRYIQAENKFVPAASINRRLLPEKKCFAAVDVEKNLFRTVVGWTWDKLFKRSFIEENRIVFQEIRVHNDLLFTYAALASAERITVMDELFTHQRKRGGGSISDEFKEWECTYEALFALKEYLRHSGRYERFGRDYINYAGYLLLYNMDRLKDEAQKKYQALMHEKWLDELGISEEEEDRFYDKGHYKRLCAIQYSNLGEAPLGMDAGKKPKVTIIIPSLNSIAYMEECIQSAVSQTLREVEIICVDAGSTDGTVELLERYAAADPRIRIVHSEKRSYGHQVNLGLDLAQGEYFAILESDDYVLTEMYETLYELALSNRCDGVKSDWCIFVGEGEERTFTRRHLVEDKALYRKVLYPRKDTELFRANNINTPGIYSMELIRRRGIRLNESPGASFQDNGLWFQIFMWAESMYFHPKAFYMIRRDNPGSSVHSREKVYCCCDEYDYIRRIVLSTPEAEKYAPICAYFRFCNYNFTLNRIGQEFRLEFLQRYAQDFQKLRQEGELAPDWFTKKQWETLQKIMNTPEEFYYTSYAGKGLQEVGRSMPTDVEGLQREVRLLRTQVNVLKKEIENIHASTTYKIGRLITWIPRMLRGGLRCLREHGFSYTMERVLIHLRLKKGKNKPLPAGNVSRPLPAKPPAVKKDYDFYSKLPAEKYPEELKLWYQRVMGTELNLETPRTFNEKIQWMKLYDSTPTKTLLADKYLVRDWVKEKIGEEYLIPLLGVWDSFDEIDFDKLPDQFALKANHGSGWNIIVKDKASFDKAEAKKKFDSWMEKNYAYCYGMELHYINIPPKIIAEQYIQNADGLIDYRFYCFHGRLEQVWVDIYSGTPQHLRSVYDMDWNLLPLKCTWPEGGELLSKKPKNFEKMKEFAALLSKEFAFVRVDFFEVDEKLYMGEMTFTPMSGTGKFEPTDWNFKLGEILTLPPKSPIPERKF